MFWGVIAASLIFSALGILKKRIYFGILGTIFALPVALYLGGTPKFSVFISLLPLFQVASTYYIYRENYKLAWLLLLPFTGVSIFLAKLVFLG